jgi:hypothetical protein
MDPMQGRLWHRSLTQNGVTAGMDPFSETMPITIARPAIHLRDRSRMAEKEAAWTDQVDETNKCEGDIKDVLHQVAAQSYGSKWRDTS